MSVTDPQTPSSPSAINKTKSYDYLLKFLLVGDSDVGKEEILSGLDDGASESPYGFSTGEGNDNQLSIIDLNKRVRSSDWAAHAS